MVEVEFRFNGRDLRDATDRLSDLQKEVGDKLEDPADEIGLRIVRTAKRLVRVDTGRLRASLDYGVREAGEWGIKIVCGSNVDYADIIEADYPYLRPAIEQNEDTIKRITRDALQDAARAAR